MSNKGRGSMEGLLQMLAVLQTMRGVMGTAESQIHTQEQVRDRPRVAMVAWFNLIVGGLAAVGGLVLHVWGWIYATGADLALGTAGVGLCLYLLLLFVLAAMLRRRFGWPVLQGYLWSLGFTWLAALLVLLAMAQIRYAGGLIAVFVGLVVDLATVPFVYNQYKELVEPYWRRSPYEEAIQKKLFPGITMLLTGEDGEPTQQVHVLEVRSRRGEFITSNDSLGMEPNRLLRFAYELEQSEYDLREATWGPRRRIFRSYPHYRAVLAEMARQELVAKVNPEVANSPYRITAEGREVMERLATAYEERELDPV